MLWYSSRDLPRDQSPSRPDTLRGSLIAWCSLQVLPQDPPPSRLDHLWGLALIAGLASVSASGVSRSEGSFDVIALIAGLASVSASGVSRSEGSLDVKAVIPGLASTSASGVLRSEGSGAITATIAGLAAASASPEVLRSVGSLDDRVIPWLPNVVGPRTMQQQVVELVPR